MINCHICGGKLKSIPSFSSLFQVTSDCRPWTSKGELAVCTECFIVQKPKSVKWVNEIHDIYKGYQIYLQGNGVEQSTFDATSGASLARSQKILSWIKGLNISSNGKLLDIGCGNGSFMKAFNNEYPKWEMTGLELDDKNKSIVESIDGVKKLHVGEVDSLDEKYDFIVLIHALEHITEPIDLLQKIKNILNPGGFLFIEVPDLKTSPFDLLIADHCSHFTIDTLSNVVNNAGFEIVNKVADFVPKEISLLATIQNKNERQELYLDESGEKTALANIEWMKSLLSKASGCKENIAVFGTSISATWLASTLGDKISFFVDEDSNRIGGKHLGKDILAPEKVTENYTILMPLRKDIANNISKRLIAKGIKLNFIN
jgi:2-polyprenyl-3-methyl-5-hydroxy-6-metoxy-1,4-benzoquinol methylase